MPPGSKPLPPGTSSQRGTVNVWQYPEGLGWQHGRIPRPPAILETDEAKAAWKDWLGSWWAAFYTPDDLRMLGILVHLVDRMVKGEISASQVTPLLDRFGITPKGRQDLRWAERPASKAPAATAEPSDEIAARRETRKANLA